jgi:hypothetical protein
MSYNVATVVTGVLKSAATKADQIVKRAELIEELKAAGVNLGNVTQWALEHNYDLPVDRSDLTKIRKVVGRLRMTAKCLAWDFDRSKELNVSLEPCSKEMPIRFSYRTKFRKGGKCEVQEVVSQARVDKTLVCRK